MDQVNQVQRLPPEVWKLIAENVMAKSTQTAINLTNAIPLFRELLKNSRPVFLFENVIQIVAENVWKRDGLEGFPVNDILKCRQVCSKWNNVIIQLIEQHFRNFGSENDKLVPVGNAFDRVLNSYRFTNDTENDQLPKESVINFIRHFASTHTGQSTRKDPTIWGSVTIDVNFTNNAEDWEDFQYFCMGISTMLSLYGKNLKKLTLIVNGYQFFENAEVLSEWFRHISNIQELQFTGEAFGFNYPDELNMEAFEGDFGFLRLGKLQSLYFEGIPVPIFSGLIMQNPQLKKLTMLFWKADDTISKITLPTIKELEMENNSPIIIDTLTLSLDLPIQSLKLGITNELPEGLLFAEIFVIIQEKFSNTLVSLELGVLEPEDYWKPQIWIDSHDRRLNLPKLRDIRLRMKDFPISFDFLLPMSRNLEKIFVQVGYKVPELPEDCSTIKDSIVNFAGYERNMYISNIWEVFENLEQIEVVIEEEEVEHSLMYCREDWKQNKPGNQI